MGNGGWFRGRLPRIGYGAGAVLSAVLGVYLFLRADWSEEWGPIDALGAAFLVPSYLMGMRARSTRETTTADAVAALARQVRSAQGQERDQLLGRTGRTVNVTYRVREPVDAQVPSERAGLAEVAEFYELSEPRRLVITGRPGAGKTVLAIELTLAVLERQSAADDPVPLRFSLAGWDGSGSFTAWLEGRIVEDYRQSREVARALVTGQLVTPFLDGLDEMDAPDVAVDESHAAAALNSIRTWRDGRRGAPLVITCRTERYEQLVRAGYFVDDAARVELDAVTAEQAHAYLSHVGRYHAERWRPLLDDLRAHPEGPLALALNTPWRLTLIATSYARQGDPGELLGLAEAEADGAGLLEAHLLSRYVAAACRTHPEEPDAYEPADAYRWLAWIAGHLGERTGFAPHLMWTMAGKRRVREADGMMMLAPWLVIGLVAMPFADSWGEGVAVLIGLGTLGLVPAGFSMLRGVRARNKARIVRIGRGRALRHFGIAVMCAVTAWLVIRPTTSITERFETPDGGYAWSRMDALEQVVTGASYLVGFLLFVAVSMSLYALLELITGRAFAERPADELPLSALDPRWPLRHDARRTLLDVVLWTTGIVAVQYLGEETEEGFLFLVFLLVFAAEFGCVLSSRNAKRYFAFLLATRSELPWNLATFLHWARGAGLLRVSGSSYEFRHIELREWLARNPQPPGEDTNSSPASRSRPSNAANTAADLPPGHPSGRSSGGSPGSA